MEKVKVIHVVHDFLFGGIESFLYYLTQAQQKNDLIEVAVLCCQKKENIKNDRIPKSGIKCYFVEIKPTDFRIKNYLAAKRIVDDYDVVHIHNFKPILCEFLSLSKSKILYTIHSAGIIGRTNTMNFKIKNNLLVRFLNRKANGVTSNSHYTQEFWTNMGMKNLNSWVVYNGILFNEDYSSEKALNEFPVLRDKFIVGTTSRFINWKRIELLIKAFNLFQKDKKDVVLVLVGDGETKFKLESLTNELDLEGKVIFTGFKTNVTDFQSIINVCVFPSISEPFGLVAVECLHLGKPVFVFSDGGGIAEIMMSIEKDHIVNTIQELAQKIEDQYEEVSIDNLESTANNRIEFSRKFDVHEIEKQFYSKYLQLIR